MARRTEEAPSPAVVPEAPEPTPTSYRVAGTQAVLGHEPGSTFTATLTPEQEEFYLTGGHLEKAKE